MRLHLEVTELRFASVYVEKHQEISIQIAYKCLEIDSLKNLRDVAVKVFSTFFGIYKCEEIFPLRT